MPGFVNWLATRSSMHLAILALLPALTLGLALVSASVSAQTLAPISDFSLDQSALRAQLTAVRYAQLSAQMSGKIERLAVREGDRVSKGQLLVEFECDLQQAKLARALAEQAAAKNSLQGNQRMAELNAIGKVELINSELEVRKISADVQYLQAMISRCRIKAPYAGVIGELAAREQEVVQESAPLLEIIDDSALQLEFIVPSRWLSWLVEGYAFQVRLEDTQTRYPAKLIYTAAKVDAMSQSVKAVATIDGVFPELRPGMSGQVELTPPGR